jgi:hypothetical protein
MKTARIPAENTTPNTGYQSKKNSLMDASRGIFQGASVPTETIGRKTVRLQPPYWVAQLTASPYTVCGRYACP